MVIRQNDNEVSVDGMDVVINDFLTTKFDCKSGDIDRALNNFNNIIIDAANPSLKKTRMHKTNKLQQQKMVWPNIEANEV